MKAARANQYTERDMQAALSVLIELGTILEDIRDHVVLIGGFVPWLSLKGPPDHVGTLDVDLNFDLEAMTQLPYAAIADRLTQANYESNTVPQMPFRWRRWVTLPGSDGTPLEPMPVLVDLLAIQNEPIATQTLADTTMMPAIGSHLAHRSNHVFPLEGRTPEGSFRRVQWRVASLPALLGMKGHSMSEARAKDAYDIYYVLRRYPGGPRALAEACQQLLTDDLAVRAYQRIRDHFRAEDDLGAQLVGSFLLESSALGELTVEQVMQDAFQRVQLWAKTLKLPA
jgi:hypothetical protein